MIDEIIMKDRGYVPHEWVSHQIIVRFGRDWDYYNENGNPCRGPAHPEGVPQAARRDDRVGQERRELVTHLT